LKVLQPTLSKRGQRQPAPLEPAAEIGQYVTLCTNRIRGVPLAKELRCKALDMGGQWPAQERPSSAVAAPWRVIIIVRLLKVPGKSPAGDDSRIMPRNQAPLPAQIADRRHALRTTDDTE